MTYQDQPQTAYDVCQHEIAHAVSACLTLHRTAPKYYSDMLLHIDAKGAVFVTFTGEVPAHIRKKVMALAALGPLALMPQEHIAETLRLAAYEKAGVLSDRDISVLYEITTSKNERDTSILATLAHFNIYAEKLARVTDELIGITDLDILAPLLVPREMAHVSNTTSLMLGLDQRLGQSYKGTLRNARDKIAKG